MKNLFKALDKKWEAATIKENQRKEALPNAKKAGRKEYLKTAVAFPWEKDPYGKYLNKPEEKKPLNQPQILRFPPIIGTGPQPSPSMSPSPNLFKPTPTPMPSMTPTPPLAKAGATGTPKPMPSPFATPGYKPFTKMAPNWGEIMRQTDQVAKEYGLPSSVVLAQVAAESGRGTHKYSARNNFFNIGAYDSNPDNAFSYATPAAGIKAYADLITKDPRYSKAYAARGNADDFLRLLTEAGYAGDPKTYKKRGGGGSNYIDFVKSTPEYKFYNKR